MELGILALEMATGMQRLICSAKGRSYKDAVFPRGPLYHLIACPCCWKFAKRVVEMSDMLQMEKRKVINCSGGG